MAKELDKFNKKEKKLDFAELKRVAKLYIFPIAVGIVFVVIILVLIIPQIGYLTDLSGQLQETEKKIGEVNSEIDKYIQFATDEIPLINERLEVINSIAPSGLTKLVNFRSKITDLAFKNSLNVYSQRLSESNLEQNKVEEEESGATFNLQEIPSQFEISGTYNNIMNFIDDLSGVQDFIIVKQMNLSRDSDNRWNLQLLFTKYQFSIQESENLSVKYQSVPLEAKVGDDLIEYLDSKVQSVEDVVQDTENPDSVNEVDINSPVSFPL